MHIPDNYLSPSTCVVLGATMLPVWKRASNKVKKELSRKKMPMLGIAAAFSFLIMMFNLPVPGGTTAHAVGAALIAILLGPYSAVISITIAIAVQALFFGDGGILAFGANTFNMAFIMPFAAYYIYRFIRGKGDNKRIDYIAAFVSGYVSINIAAFFAAIELGIQPILFKDALGRPMYCPYPLRVSIPAMLIPHMLVIGFVEGFITAAIYAYVKRVSPDFIYEGSGLRKRPLYAALTVLIMASPLGILAAGTAWGEWGPSELKSMMGYVPSGMKGGTGFSALMKGYGLSGVSRWMGYLLSALLGVAVIMIIFKLLNRKTQNIDK